MQMSDALRLLGYGALPGGSVMIEAQELKELAKIDREGTSGQNPLSGLIPDQNATAGPDSVAGRRQSEAGEVPKEDLKP